MQQDSPTFSVHPPITDETKPETLEAIKAVAAAAHDLLGQTEKLKAERLRRANLSGPVLGSPNSRKRKRRAVAKARKANR